MVGRVWPRHSGCGRPLNSVVRSHQMSRWDPRPPLDVNPWSLLPSIGFSKRAAVIVEIIWALYVFGFLICRSGEIGGYLLLGLAGGWALYYIANRLGGRTAKPFRAGPEISSESMFQMRLIGDVAHILILASTAYGIAVDVPGLR